MPQLPDNNLILGGLTAAAVGLMGVAMVYSFLRRNRRKYMPVGVVSKIFVHRPIKSCKGLEVSEAECGALGIQWKGLMDRSFMIIDANGRFITQRQQPCLALLAPSLSENRRSLLLDAPGMPTLSVPLDDETGDVHQVTVWRLSLPGRDCGKAAADWLSQYIGSPGCRLVRHNAKLGSKILKDDSKWGTKAKKGEEAIYQDLGQYLLLGEASLDNLNARLDKPVTFMNFRPNIVVEGSSAFMEDSWKYVRIGNVEMRITHKCARCKMTTVDTSTGKFREDGDPLKTLKEYRLACPSDPDQSTFGPSPLFGVNTAVEMQGPIKVGDVIQASYE